MVSSLAFWVVIAAVGVIEAAIITAALRMQVASNPSRGVLGARMTEVLWTLLPALLIVAMAVLSFDALQERDADATDPASTIAKQRLASTAPQVERHGGVPFNR